MTIDRSTQATRLDFVLRAFIEMARSFLAIRNAESKEFEAIGLTVGQFSVLEILTHKGDQSVGAIMKLMFSTPGNMTVLIKNLETKGFIKVVTPNNDKRSKMVSITPTGKELIDSMWNDHTKLLSSFFDKLEDEEIVNLAKTLRKMRKG